METAMGYLTEDKGVAWFSSDENKWHRRMAQLADEHPEDVKITVRPEGNDGCMNATFPSAWLRIRPPRKREMTDEQKAAAAERLRKAREEKNNNGDEDEEMEDEE